MNKSFYSIVFLLLLCILSACQTGKEQGVVINGVRWATHNVQITGSFTKDPSDMGGLFTWEEAKIACPRGWRLPTSDEMQLLREAAGEWIVQNGIVGREFGNAPHQLFLPAAGWRNNLTDGETNYVNENGHYWTSTTSGTTNAMRLAIFSSFTVVNANNQGLGFSVRCVAE